jgi:hypothetical protein
MSARALFVLAVAASLGPGALPGRSPLPGAAGQEWAGGAPGAAPPAPLFRDRASPEGAGRECGLNSLFMLLRLSGHDVTYEQTRAAVPIGPMGTSLLELQQAASRLGAKTRLSQCSMAELKREPKPVIAYFLRATGGAVDGPGHFVVVLKADDTGVEVFDNSYPTALWKYSVPHFEAQWSGHILGPAPPPIWARPLTLTAVAGVWISIGLAYWRVRVWRRARAPNARVALAQVEGARS